MNLIAQRLSLSKMKSCNLDLGSVGFITMDEWVTLEKTPVFIIQRHQISPRSITDSLNLTTAVMRQYNGTLGEYGLLRALDQNCTVYRTARTDWYKLWFTMTPPLKSTRENMQLINWKRNRLISYFADKVYSFFLLKMGCGRQTAHKIIFCFLLWTQICRHPITVKSH